jgi:hypothetical protein
MHCRSQRNICQIIQNKLQITSIDCWYQKNVCQIVHKCQRQNVPKRTSNVHSLLFYLRFRRLLPNAKHPATARAWWQMKGSHAGARRGHAHALDARSVAGRREGAAGARVGATPDPTPSGWGRAHAAEGAVASLGAATKRAGRQEIARWSQWKQPSVL